MSMTHFGLGFALGAAVTGAAPIVIKKIIPGPVPRRHIIVGGSPGRGAPTPSTPTLPSTPQLSTYDAQAAATAINTAIQAADAATSHVMRKNLVEAANVMGSAWFNLGQAIIHNQHAGGARAPIDIPGTVRRLEAAQSRLAAALRSR